MHRKSTILDQHGQPLSIPVPAHSPPKPNRSNRRGRLDASYDVITRSDKTDHWDHARDLAGYLHDSPERRNKLRTWSRHEFRNNPHLKGLVRKLIIEKLRTGPRLEIQPKSKTSAAKAASRALERNWKEYCEEIRFVRKLALALVEWTIGGDAFCRFRPNPKLSTVPVDFKVHEGEEFQTPPELAHRQLRQINEDRMIIDGIEYDRYENVVQYHKLRHHPRGHRPWNARPVYDTVTADHMAHLYEQDRPTQYRGIPLTTPVLEPYGFLREFMDSKVKQEGLRSRLLGSVETGFAPDECDGIGSEQLEFDIGGGMFLSMPGGWKAQMFRMDATGAGVLEFVRAVLSWISSVFLAPWNITGGDSSDYNFASGRLDFNIFYHAVDFDRVVYLETELLNKFFRWWLPFASDIGMVPSSLNAFEFMWYWDEREPIDRQKQARADQIEKENGMLDEHKYWQDRGQSAEDAIEKQLRLQAFKLQKAKEIAEEFELDEDALLSFVGVNDSEEQETGEQDAVDSQTT